MSNGNLSKAAKIRQEMIKAFEEGKEKFTLIADNSEQVVFNLKPLLTGRPDNIVLDKYINRLMANPREG